MKVLIMNDSPDTWIGKVLKETREARGLSLDEVYAAIRINPQFLRAIEENNYSELPGAAYIKPFIKSYSQFLGVNVDSMLGTIRSRIEDDVMEEPVKARRRSDLNRWLQVSVFLIVALAAIFFFGNRSALIDGNVFRENAGSTVESGIAGDNGNKLLLEVMAFGPADLIIVNDGDTLFCDRIGRGDVIRFADRESYRLIASSPENIRIFGNGSPLLITTDPGKRLDIILDNSSVISLKDSLLEGETVYGHN